MNYKGGGLRSYAVVHVAFGLAVFGVVALGLVLHRWTLQTGDSAQDLLRSDEILTIASTVNEQLARAESGIRGHLLAGNIDYLVEHRRALAALDQAVARLAELAAGDAAQQGRVAQLRELIAARTAQWNEIRSRQRTRGAKAARPLADAGGVQASFPVYEATRAIRAHEQAGRAAREARYARHYERATTIQATTIATCLLFLLLGYITFLRQTGARNRAERMITDLTEHVPGALFRYRQARGGASRYEHLSRDVSSLFGVDHDTAMRSPGTLLAHVVEEDRPPLASAIRRAARTLGQFRHEFRARRPGGATRWVRSSASLRAEDDTVLWNGYWVDITEQKEAEAERDRFFTMSIDLLAVAGADGYFKRLNPAFTLVLGWSLEELMARPFLEFVHPDDVAPTNAVVAHLLESREPVVDFKNRYRHKDGSWRVLAWRAVVSDGWFYATARDVTADDRHQRDLHAAKDAADAASRAKSTFLAMMSHEIRTPLNGVLGMLELLALTPLDVEQRTSVEVIRQSGESLKRIIDDILEFSKIEAGRLDIRPEPASVADVVAAVRNIYSGVASQKGLLLDHHVDPDISPVLMVDALRLQQVLNNFVNNALKFTAAGRVQITAERLARLDGEERVRFTVADTGIGIPPEQQARLFQPFAQAESDTTRRFGGTGLGLTISRRLAELMGGTVEMDSAPGKGTRISLTLNLPLADPRAVPTAVPPAGVAPVLRGRVRTAPTAAAARDEGTLVLVVDDHATNRRLLVRQLQVLGYAAETADDGAEALACWEKGAYGIVLADCNMPVMDGYELTRRIRAAEAARGLPRTPIIACTANALRGEAETCLAAGMDGYLSKPVQLMALQAQLGRWLPLPDPDETAPRAEAPPAVPADALALDRRVLHAVTGGEAAVESDILADFQRINDADVATLAQALAARDADRLARLAHRMKGACRMIGANALARACERLEVAAHAGDANVLEESAARVRHEAARLREAIAGGAGTSPDGAVQSRETPDWRSGEGRSSNP